MDSIKKSTFYVDTKTLKALKYKAVSEGKTLSQLVNELLRSGIETEYCDMVQPKTQADQ